VSEVAAKKRTKLNDIALLKRFWPYVAPDALWVVIGLLAVPLMSLAGVVQPWLLKEAVDGPMTDALQHRTHPGWLDGGTGWTLTSVALTFLGAVLAEYCLRGLQLWALQRAGYRALQRLRRGVFAHVLAQGSAFFDTRASGNLLTRTTTDVEAIGEVLTFGIVGIIGDVFDILFILGAMLWFDIRLTAMSLLVAPFIVLLVNVFRRRLRHYSTEIRRSMAQAAGHFQEALAGARIVQLHGREEATLDEYRSFNYRYLDAYRISNWYDASLYAVMDGVAGLCIAILLGYGAGRVVVGLGTLGLLIAFIQYIQRVFVPVRELSGKVATIERAQAALERIFGLLDEAVPLASGTQVPQQIQGRVQLEHLSFSYGKDTQVLDDVSLTVQPGQIVALVGQTGSGKSTLVKLIARMYDAPKRAIFVDGVAVEDWQLQALRRAIGVVQQDVMLFSGTFADNVSLGREGITRQMIEQAVEDAQLSGKVARLGGLDTLLSENGGNLSAGERQLLSIARILAANPPIVVLDEATASIDTETEQAVQRALDRVFQGRTAIVVAHRLSTIRKAGRIVVMQRGRIAETGTHDELLVHGGLYAHLVAAAQESQKLLQ
jgi:ATP-binding cassette subfamily B multidrug efflux pump